MVKKRIDLRDVAALAGVSLGSASRTINGAAYVSKETRERVERAIGLLGYRPSHAARALRSRSSKTIGCMLSEATNPLYARLFQAMEERLRAEGYVLLLATGLNNAERELETLQLFAERGMDGMILTPGNERDHRIVDFLNTSDMPTVILDRDIETGKDVVLFNHTPAVKRITRELLNLGHRRIALLVSRVDVRPNRRRIEAFKAAMREFGETASAVSIHLQTTSTSSTFDEVVGLLKGPAPPTALMVQGTNTLLSVLNAIAAAGLRIPDDISIISIGDPDFARTHVPPISALKVSTEAIVERTVELLMNRIKGDRAASPQRALVQFDFEKRQSCAAPNAASSPHLHESASKARSAMPSRRQLRQ